MNVTAARTTVREAAQKGLDIVADDTLTVAEKKSAMEKIAAVRDEALQVIELDRQAKAFLAGNSEGEAGMDVPSLDSQLLPADLSAKSVGAQFAESAARKAAGQAMAERSRGMWSFEAKAAATITEGGTPSGYGMSGTGGALVTPQFLPGMVPLLFQPLTIADLMPQARATSPVITYAVMSSFTNNAAVVPEGGKKPLSDMTWARRVDEVAKIAHLMKVTSETLEDAPQIQAWIDNYLMFGVQVQEEYQLLNGTAANGIQGLLNRSGMTPATTVGATPKPVDLMNGIFKAITTLTTQAFIRPDAFVINPLDWQTIRLGTDNNGQFYGGGPFPYGPYGNGSMQPVVGDVNLWGLRGVATNAMPQGTILVGAFQQSTMLFRRSGITLEMTNSNVDDFENNLVTARAEERLGLAVPRPAGLTLVKAA